MGFLKSLNPFLSTVKKRKIVPGTNVIPNSELEALCDVPFVKDMLARKKYVITMGENLEFVDKSGNDISSALTDSKKAAMEISELTVKEAKIKIAGDPTDEEDHGILDIEVLREILKIDTRKGIQDAVEEQIEMLVEDTKEDDEE